VFDTALIGKSFGAVLVDVKTTAGDTVSAQLVGGGDVPSARLQAIT
jgi:hypothetical protein